MGKWKWMTAAGDWLARLISAGMILYAEYMIINALFPNTPLK